MKYPTILIKPKEAPLYFCKKETDFGLVSKGGEEFYSKGYLFDSHGDKFQINGIESLKNAPLLKSIIHFQPMYNVVVKYDHLERIELNEFKKIIIDHIYSYKKYWASRDTPEHLEIEINKKDNFVDLINFLR